MNVYTPNSQKFENERYYIFLKERNKFSFNIFLHRFLNSDPDDLHDYPWDFRNLILYGGYWEYTENGKFWKGPLSYRYMLETTFHRIELEKKKYFLLLDIIYSWKNNKKLGI